MFKKDKLNNIYTPIYSSYTILFIYFSCYEYWIIAASRDVKHIFCYPDKEFSHYLNAHTSTMEHDGDIKNCYAQRQYIYTYIYIYIYIYISSSSSYHRHGYPRPSLAISTYRSSPLAGLQGYIPYPHIAAARMFGHMWGSIGVHHLWASPCFSSSDLHVWFV